MRTANQNRSCIRRRGVLGLILAGTVAATALSAAASAIAAPVDLAVVDRDSDRPLAVWTWQGRQFVAGAPGARYGLRLTNNTPGRILAVVSVDGVNVITGETASYDQEGYILAPYQTYEVTGWRKSLGMVAAFNFTAIQNSYAAETGRPSDVGVIGMAVFNERPAPQAAAAKLKQGLSFNIPSRDAPTALAAWSAASGIKIDAPASLTNGVTTKAVSGAMDPRDALEALIAGTKLIIIRDDGDTISLGASGSDTVSAVTVTATGASIAGVKAVGSPVQRLNREDLLKSGATSLHDALNTLPALQSGGGGGVDYGLLNGADPAASQRANAIGGQGSRATLAPIDGQRLAQSGAAEAGRGGPSPPLQPGAPLGTGEGALERSAIVMLSFVRASPTPMQVTQIQYDSYDNLRAKGVIPAAPPAPRPPQPFPNQGFVPDPPR